VGTQNQPLSVKDGGLDKGFCLMFCTPFFFGPFYQIGQFMIAKKVLPRKADQVRKGYFLFDAFLRACLNFIQ